jgi:hypothetical protein
MRVIYRSLEVNYKIERNYDKTLTYFDVPLFTHYIHNRPSMGNHLKRYQFILYML